MKPSLRLRFALLGGLLAGAFTAQATNPVLTFKGLTTTGDNTAFIDQVQILSGATGNMVVASAIVNSSFESSDPLANGTYGYVPTGAVWNFGAGSGITVENTGFNSPTAFDGAHMAFLQGGSQFQQTLTLPAGATLYRVRFRVVQRLYSTPPAAAAVTNVQKVQVLIDGAVVIDNVQPTVTNFNGNTNTYTYTTATFTVGTSTPFALTALAPTRNALGAVRTNAVGQTFSEAVNAASASNVSLFSSQYGGNLKTKLPLSISGSQVSYVPDRYFKAGEVVSVTVPNTVVSNALGKASNKAQVYQFTVATKDNGTNNGVFSGSQNINVDNNPRSTAMTDADGDGLLDLVVTSEGSIRIFRNTGNSGSPIAPTFAANPLVLNIPNGAVAYAMAVGDVDGDGRIDIVTANTVSDNVSVFRNTSTSGTVSFAASQEYDVANDAYAVALGDLDGDGDLDIATVTYANSSARVSLLRNVIPSAATLAANGLPAGTGALTENSFATEVNFYIGNSVRYGIALGDLDSDGKLDIITANYGPNTVGVNRNLTNSPATLDFDDAVLFDVGISPITVAVGDVNGDGRLDIVTANYDDDNVTILQNSTPANSTAINASRTDISVGNQPYGITTGDITGDGKLNILATNYNAGNTGTVSVIQRNTNNDGYVLRAGTLSVGNGPRGIALGDVDGDGDLDLATANFAPNTLSFRINGTSAAVLPLPVELVSFAAKCTGTGTLLTWRTASEKNSAGFDVQRSADGKSFASIATVESQGNSTSGGTYTTTDERASGQAYYRLRMVDADGTTTYSPVATASCATQLEAASGLTLVPNPAQGRVQVLGANEAVQLQDLTGRVLRQQSSTELLSLEGLAPGIYLVRSGKHTARLQVQ